MKVRLYLDVDGVINAFDGSTTRPADGFAGWSDWDVRRAYGYAIRFSHELLRRLEAVSKRDHVEIRWLTTWRHLAASDLSQALDLAGTEWVIVPDSVRPATGAWWKLLAIQDDWDEESAIIWVDDDLKFDPDAREWLDTVAGVPVLGVSPKTSTGLTLDELSRIERFIDELEAV